MEYVLIDSCVLITSSLFWDHTVRGKKVRLTQKKFKECEALFKIFKDNHANIKCVVTKTVESEATGVLKKAVNSFIDDNTPKIVDILDKFNYSTLGSIIYDRSLDRMEEFIEEHSTRLPMSRELVEKILIEVNDFFKTTMPETVRYLAPPKILKRLKGSIEGKKEILESIQKVIPDDKIIYIKGEPGSKDKRIMAEATFIKRQQKKERVFIASLDYHYIPNPLQIDSYKSPLYFRDSSNTDTKMRDLLSQKFGFHSDRPKEIIAIIN